MIDVWYVDTTVSEVYVASITSKEVVCI